MITSLLIDSPSAGALPFYPMAESHFYSYQEGQWQWRYSHRGRALVSQDIDMLATDLQRALPQILSTGPEDGSLIFIQRGMLLADEGVYVFGGMALVPNQELGVPLDGADAATLLGDFLVGVNGANSAALHPATQDAFARMIRWRESEERRIDEMRAADSKAKSLLEGHLTASQFETYRRTGAFLVVLDGRRFLVTSKYGHGVLLLEGDRPVESYCIIPKIDVPGCDRLLAQKVMLEAAPEEFFRIANFLDLRDVPDAKLAHFREFLGALVDPSPPTTVGTP